MSNSHDAKGDLSKFELITDIDPSKYFEDVFVEFCENRFPGCGDRNNILYYKTVVASKYFAQSMLDDANNIERAYEVGLSIMSDSIAVN